VLGFQRIPALTGGEGKGNVQPLSAFDAEFQRIPALTSREGALERWR